MTKSPPSAQDVAKVMPTCPSCGCDRYCSITENGSGGFLLKSLRCENCQFDILKAFNQVEGANGDPKLAMAWSVVLCFLIVSEIVLIATQVWG